VEVTHEKFLVTINREPFLTEADLDSAKVVEGIGGFSIQLVFGQHGTLLLDMMTTSYKGKRVVIMTQSPKTTWIAAPLIKTRNPSGIFTFTPDCTREEADRIVNGLNNVVAKAKKDELF
jgi:hypothetical protein